MGRGFGVKFDANKLKALLKLRRLTYAKFCTKYGVNINTFNYWLKVERMPKIDRQDIANYFGVSVDYLAGEVDE